MGRRGPTPKPRIVDPAEKAHQTVGGAHRRIRLTPPAELKGHARRCWQRNVAKLDAMGIIDGIDRDALIVYCQTWSQWKTAIKIVERKGQSYPIFNPEGSVRCYMQLPEVNIARSLAQLIHRYQLEFGLTPSARAKIEVPYADDGDREMEALLRDTGT